MACLFLLPLFRCVGHSFAVMVVIVYLLTLFMSFILFPTKPPNNKPPISKPNNKPNSSKPNSNQPSKNVLLPGDLSPPITKTYYTLVL